MQNGKKIPNTFFTAECVNCKEKFIVNTFNLKVRKFDVNNGQSIILTYYDCPHCGHRMFVQADDDTTKEMLSNVTNQLKQFSIAKNKGEKVSQKQLDKFKKTREDLSNYRIALMKEYAGKFIFDNELCKTFELRFNYEVFINK